jgi:hypothetical protein
MEGNRTVWEETSWMMYIDTKFVVTFKENIINTK